MKLTVEKDIKTNDFYVTFNLVEITNVEEEQLSDFGKLKIEIGKTIPLSATESFKLGSEEKILPDGFPFTKIFKSVTYGEDTESHALAYIAEIKERVTAATNILTSKEDTFSGIEEIQL